jgi:hypothetical protein
MKPYVIDVGKTNGHSDFWVVYADSEGEADVNFRSTIQRMRNNYQNEIKGYSIHEAKTIP